MTRQLSLKIDPAGVRGIVGESLTPQLVVSFAAAFGSYCGAGPVILGSDCRPTREMILQAAVAGLMSVGCTPVDAGIIPAPALMLAVRETGAFGGIAIGAARTHEAWSALKFIGPGGLVLQPNQAAELTDLYHQGVYVRVGAREIPGLRSDDSLLRRHREAVLGVVDAGAIRARGFRVAVDCCNGAASEATPALLAELGCTVFATGTQMGSPFPRNPEPLPEHLDRLSALVRETGAQIGFAQDSSGDRLGVVDEEGRPLGEDAALALCVARWLERAPGPVVVNVSASRAVDDIAARRGCAAHRTPVGECYVIDRMNETEAWIGGEGGGGVIIRQVHACRDSLAAVALILESLAIRGGTVSELHRQIPACVMVRERIRCPAREVAPSLRLLESRYRGERIDRSDGLRVIWPDRSLLARSSGSEPVIRLQAEAPTEGEARALMRDALECLSPTME